jgi:hypothetical protein
MSANIGTVYVNVKSLSKAQLAAAFNMWMKRYTENPEQFEHEWQSVNQFLTEEANGEEPSYGESCAAYLLRLLDEVA